MIKDKIEWFKIWNYWRKGSGNPLIQKLFVLFKIIESPTFDEGVIKMNMKKLFMQNVFNEILKRTYLDRYTCYGCIHYKSLDEDVYCELRNCVHYFKINNEDRKCPCFSDDIKFRYNIIKGYLNCCIKKNNKEN